MGFALGGKPASIKNYRDEFDPLFPNRRKGWHKRSPRDYCLEVCHEYQSLDLATFSGLIKSFAGYDENAWSEVQSKEDKTEVESGFAKRMVTGLAAEQYFEAVHSQLPEFKGHTVENTTRLGCGYDFRLSSDGGQNFLAVEVKGMRESSGSLLMTPKEYETASTLTGRFFLFVVKNFRDAPFHEIYRDPLGGNLLFKKKERVIVSVSWFASV